MDDKKPQVLLLTQQKTTTHRFVFIPMLFFILLISFNQGVHVFLFAQIHVLIFLCFEVCQLKSVEIDFKEKTATFNYYKFNPFKKSKTVSIAEFNFVYASAHSEGYGWVIKLSNHKGKYLRLISRDQFSGQKSKSPEPVKICNELAQGLSIRNGGGL
ncbi:hypothetical protein [Limnohabitans sp.]|jgi:hypothetical protein